MKDNTFHIILLMMTGPVFGFNPRAIEDFICFGNPTDTLVPHPEECESYFICDGGLAKKRACHPGINFNPILSQCDPNYKDCNGPPGSESNTTQSSNQNTADSDTANITVTPRPGMNSTNNETIHQQACPLIDTPELTFLPSVEYCDQFYLCYYGKPMRFDCSGGYYWSQSKKTCVQPHQSECQIPSPISQLNPRCPTLGRLFYPHPRDCGNFYYCENGVKSVQRCQAFYHWDVQEKRCVLKTRAICIKSIPMNLRRSFYQF